MRAILKEGSQPENKADSYSQSSEFDDGSEQEEDVKLDNVEMKEDRMDSKTSNNKLVKNR